MCFTQIAGHNIVLHSFSVEIPATDISECEEVLVVRVCRTQVPSILILNIMQKNNYLLCFVKL